MCDAMATKNGAILQPSYTACVSLPPAIESDVQADIAQLVEQRIRNA